MQLEACLQTRESLTADVGPQAAQQRYAEALHLADFMLIHPAQRRQQPTALQLVAAFAALLSAIFEVGAACLLFRSPYHTIPSYRLRTGPVMTCMHHLFILYEIEVLM